MIDPKSLLLTSEEYFHQGNELCDIGNYEEALGYYEEAIKLKPDFADAYYAKGCLLYTSDAADE